PFFINYGLPIGEWAARFRERGFPKDPWALHGVTVEVPDPAASAGWLADVLGLEVSRIGQDAARVALPGCAITFARGPADRITAVTLTGPGAPQGLGGRAALPGHGPGGFSCTYVSRPGAGRRAACPVAAGRPLSPSTLDHHRPPTAPGRPRANSCRIVRP